ncbi:hypothetical protein ACQ1ZF_14545, partial [Enterococcus faecalis]|uniref:hypothetical protein n=1 Tax=Enterococcus faecalis TaxID=1351 RepID=UPI003D6B17B5
GGGGETGKNPNPTTEGMGATHHKPDWSQTYENAPKQKNKKKEEGLFVLFFFVRRKRDKRDKSCKDQRHCEE